MPPATITPDELKSRLALGDCCLVDVREPVEHAEEHIAGARLIPLGELEQRVHEITRDQPLVIMCRSGKRGGQGLAKLQAMSKMPWNRVSGQSSCASGSCSAPK